MLQGVGEKIRVDGTGPVSGTESKGISLLPLSRSSSSALCTFKVSLTPGPRTRPGGSQNKDSLTPHRGLLTLQGHFPQGGRQPGPCMQDADLLLLLLFPFSACSPLCTHPSAAAAADAVHLRAEFLSSATGPDAHPPRLTLPCPPPPRHLWALAERREMRGERERARPTHPGALRRLQGSHGAPGGGFLALQAALGPRAAILGLAMPPPIGVQFSTCLPHCSGALVVGIPRPSTL